MFTESNAIVHIVDDDAGMRNSLGMLVQSVSLPSRSYASAEEFLSEADLTQAGCVLLDLRMPGMGGIELLQRLRAASVGIPVILISGHADVPTTVRGMKLGAVDLLQKPIEPSVLIDAVRRNLDVSRAMNQQRNGSQSIRDRFAALTRRETELLKLIVNGHSNKQIATGIGISIKTVANHRASLMAKTGAVNAADLVRLFTIADPSASRQTEQSS